MSNYKLLPCPFCGTPYNKPERDTDGTWFVQCYMCSAMKSECYETEAEAAEAWNTRHESIKFKDFMDMYDNWNGMVVVNDNNLNSLVKNQAVFIVDAGSSLHDKEVVSFGFYDNELCVRVK